MDIESSVMHCDTSKCMFNKQVNARIIRKANILTNSSEVYDVAFLSGGKQLARSPQEVA